MKASIFLICLIALLYRGHAEAPSFEIVRYISTPLEGDAKRELRMQSVILKPGGAVPFHAHPGDQWTAVQEGNVTITVKGQEPKTYKVGESLHIPRGTFHKSENLTKKAARTVEAFVLDKDKPPIQFEK